MDWENDIVNLHMGLWSAGERGGDWEDELSLKDLTERNVPQLATEPSEWREVQSLRSARLRIRLT